MTMALPAVFAACSNDDFMEKSAAPVVDDGRRLVGEVVINPSFAEKADTRLDWVDKGDGYYPQIEALYDAIGGVQIDKYSSTSWPHFKLSNDINTNYDYRIGKDEEGNTVWKASSPATEGNYIFYMNYDSKMMGRGAMYDVVEPVQYAKDRDGNFDAYGALDNQFYMGYDFLTADDAVNGIKEIDPRMTAIHSMIRVRAHYTDNGQVKIKKIAIRKAGSLQDLKNYFGSYTNGSITYAPMTTKVDIKPLTTQMTTGFLDPACMANDIYQLKKNKDGVTISGEKGSETLEDYDALMQSLVYPNWDEENLTYQYELNFADCEETTLGDGDYAEGWILMPTANFQYEINKDHVDDATGEAAKMVIAIYTDKGMFEVPMSTDNVDLSGVISNVRVNGDLESLKPGKAAYFDVYFDNAAASNAPKTFTVNNTTDLLEQLKMFEGTDAEVTLHFYSAGDDVRMTQEVYDILAAKSNIKLTLEAGQLVINSDLNLKDAKSPVNLIYLDDEYEGASLVKKILEDGFNWDVVAPVIVVEGEYAAENFNYVGKSGQTLGNLIQEAMQKEVPVFGDHLLYNDIALPAIKVAEGGKLTVSGPIAARVEVAEGGRLVVKEAKNNALLSLANFGDVTIKGVDLFRAFHVFNGAGATLNINANVEFSLYNDRDVKMNENCCLDDENAFTWTWGTVNIAEGVKATLYGLKYMSHTDIWYGNWGIINNNGTIDASYNGNDAAGEWNEVNSCINHGRIINGETGSIYDLINDGYVDNDGKLILTETTVWSYVDVTDANKNGTEVGVGRDGKKLGVVAYQAAENNDKLELIEDVNKLIVSAEIKMAEENSTVKEIVLKDNASLKGTFKKVEFVNAYGSSKLNGATFETGVLNVWKDANVTIAENSVLEAITVLKNGHLTIASGKQMTWNGEFKNLGLVTAESNSIVTAGADATYNAYGVGKWQGNNEPRPSMSYNDFYSELLDAVKTYIDKNTKAAAPASIDDLENAGKIKFNAKLAKVDDLEAELKKAVSEFTSNTSDLLAALAKIKYTAFDDKAYETQSKAYEAFKAQIIEGTGMTSISASVRIAANALTNAEIANLLESVQPCRYIWQETSCPLYDVMALMIKYSGEWKEIFGLKEGLGSFDDPEVVIDFLNEAGKYNGNAPKGKEAVALFEKYSGKYQSWNYSEAQVEAMYNAINE